MYIVGRLDRLQTSLWWHRAKSRCIHHLLLTVETAGTTNHHNEAHDRVGQKNSRAIMKAANTPETQKSQVNTHTNYIQLTTLAVITHRTHTHTLIKYTYRNAQNMSSDMCTCMPGYIHTYKKYCRSGNFRVKNFRMINFRVKKFRRNDPLLH